MVNKLYVLVRGDLTKSQQAVQACHAVAEWQLNAGKPELWCNETLVLLKVDNISEWFEKMDSIADHWIEFCEPDINNEITAIAALGDNLPRALRNLPLL